MPVCAGKGCPSRRRSPRPPEAVREYAEYALTEASVPIAVVHLPSAVSILLLFLAIMRVLWRVPRLRARRSAAWDEDRHAWRWIEYSQVAGVVGFLVAQLNGITEVTSLVPIYALGAGAALLLRPTRPTHRPRPCGTLGVRVRRGDRRRPGGVIAFAQIGGGLAGVGVSVLVRVVTVAALLGLASVWVVVWATGRGARERPMTLRVEGMLSVTVPLAALVLAAYVVLG